MTGAGAMTVAHGAAEGRIPVFGYLCMPAHVDRRHARVLRQEMAVYAIVSGLNITRWFVDDRSSGGGALREMLSALEEGEAARVVVPEEAHVRRPRSVTGNRWTDAPIRVDVVNDSNRVRASYVAGGCHA